MLQIQKNFDAMVENGTFRAILKRKPSNNNAQPTEKVGAPKHAAKEKSRESKTAERALVGREFEDDAIEWVVLKVERDKTLGSMMVYCYDKLEVECGIS